MDRIVIGIILVLFASAAVAAVKPFNSSRYVQTDKEAVIEVGKVRPATSTPIIPKKNYSVVSNSRDTNPSNVDVYSSRPFYKKSAINPVSIKKPIKKTNGGGFYMSAIAGASMAKLGQDQFDKTRIDPNNGYDQYLSTSDYSYSFLYGVNGGYEFKIGSHLLFSLGLGVYQNNDHSAKGQVWYRKDCPPPNEAHNLDYEYKIQTLRFMGEAQLAWQFDSIGLMPFISLGIGQALNSAHCYEESLAGKKVLVKGGFKSNTTGSLAYQLGVGISYSFSDGYDRLFLAYRYVDLGQAHFSNREEYPLYELDVGKVQAHEIYIGYTYLFNL